MGKFNAEPTKDFFIDMLTKDIPLERAIIDLIDNSVDGAKNDIIKKKGDIKANSAYKKYAIKITLSPKIFSIEDNCGGFSKKAAEEYAFKFGRPRHSEGFGVGSVGRFGVGMKRALFKMGDHFIVESKSKKDHFIVEENVQEWEGEPGKWEFDFIDVSETKIFKGHKPILKESGTYISVSKLQEGVSQDFGNKTFEKKIIDEIERTLNYSIAKGLTIEINNNELKSSPIELLVSDDLKPYFLEEKFDIKDQGTVNVKIYAGVGEPDPNSAGWYIYCNDRLMVDKDKTNLTGWEGSEKFFGDTGVQKFHNKVAMFRGLVFFSSDNSAALPMTTTKTGIDSNSTLFKAVRIRMITAMKQVLAYLNKLENDDARQEIVKNSTAFDIVAYNKNHQLSKAFVFPSLKNKGKDDDMARISYKVDRETLDLVKESLRVSSNEKVGLETFGYYVKMKEL